MIQRHVPGIGPNVLPAYRARRRAGGAGRPGLRHPGLGDAARRRQLRVRQPRAQPLSRVRRLVLAVVLAVGRRSASCRTCWCRSCATSRWRSSGTARRPRSSTAAVRVAIALAVLWAATGRQPARHQGLRAPDRAADVPDLRPRSGGDRRRLLPRPRRLRCGAAGARHRAGGARRRRAAVGRRCCRRRCCSSRRSSASTPSRRPVARRAGRAATCRWPSASPSASVALFYLLFTAAVYHAVPWQYVAAEARAPRPHRARAARPSCCRRSGRW